METPVYRREGLGAGDVLEGPAAIEESATTTLVPPGMTATVDAYGNLVVANWPDRAWPIGQTAPTGV